MAPGAHSATCECCALQSPRDRMMTWHERTLARRLKVLDPASAELAAEGWVSGPYRYYYVDHQRRVCASCHAYLSGGNKAKMAFLVLLAVVAALMAALPVLMPHLMSALWRLPGEGR